MYWSELAKRLKETNAETNFFGKEGENIFQRGLEIDTKKESVLPTGILRYLPFTKKLANKSIFHSSYYRISLQKNIINIVTVHDFVYEYFRSGLAKYVHTWQKKFALKRADGIICISENTKRDLIKFLPSANKKPIKVIYLAASDSFYPIKKIQAADKLKGVATQKYALFVGSRAVYKNFGIAVEAVARIANCQLVVVGGGELTGKEEALLNQKLGSKYQCVGYVSDDKLNRLYNSALCLLYPSSYEGFGIPVIDAMKAGCPVVSTSISSIPEVAGDAALLIDSMDPENFSKAIESLENKSFREKLVEKGFEQSKKFSWDKCFEETYSFYKRLAN